jgi:hypothetical protein
MLIAQQKREENLAEYILYLYQVEDLIRAFHLDMNLIEENLVSRYRVDETKRKEISGWYENLIAMMKREDLQKSGHLQFLTNLVNHLNELHLRLLQTQIEPLYLSAFQSVSDILNELKQKNPGAGNDTSVALDGIYGYLLLKLQKKEIAPATEQGIKQLSQWLAQLSRYFKNMEAGKLSI